MKQFVLRWAATTIAVMVASSIIRGIHYDTFAASHRGVTVAGYSQRFCSADSVDPQRAGHSAHAGLVHSGFKRTLAASSTQCRCRISCRQLLERILGRDRDQLRELGLERIFPRERWTRARFDPSYRDAPRPRSSP